MTALLEVEHLTVGVKRGRTVLPAVTDVSFQLYPGEILGIVGESGCGKTLTARAIPGLLPQGVRITAGDIRFKGRALQKLSEKERRSVRGADIAMIFQEPMRSLNPLMKIGRQIGEALTLHGIRDKKLVRRRTLTAMAQAGLPDPEALADAYPHQLSGGMCQRAMIAGALITEPQLLIADEPTTALDVTIQSRIIRLLKTINHDRGTAILFISHDLEVIRRLCGRVLVMYAGKFVEAGAVQDLFARPQHEYTKGLIGSIPEEARKGLPLTAIPGKAPSLEEAGELRGICPFAPRCVRVEPECSAGFPAKRIVKAGWYVHCPGAEDTEG